MTTSLSIGLAILSSVLSAFGQVGLKFGAQKLKKTVKGMITNYALITGILLYLVSTAVFVIALKGGELSVMYPLISLTYIWVGFLSQKYFGEKMNTLKWSGVALIIVGVALII